MVKDYQCRGTFYFMVWDAVLVEELLLKQLELWMM